MQVAFNRRGKRLRTIERIRVIWNVFSTSIIKVNLDNADNIDTDNCSKMDVELCKKLKINAITYVEFET